MQQYFSSHSGGGYSETILLTIENKIFRLDYKHVCMGDGGAEFTLHGDVVSVDKNYYVLGINGYNDDKLNCRSAILDVYIFSEKMITDDALHLTEISIASNTPSYNKYFDCVIYLNKNVMIHPDLDMQVINNLERLSGTKMLKKDGNKIEKAGWSYDYDKESNKIVRYHY